MKGKYAEDEAEDSVDPDRLRAEKVNPKILSTLNRPTVKGYMFLTPTAYSHLMEAYELIQQHSRKKLDLEELVCNKDYSTYFARLVAVRIQISRFLGGRYYSAASNHERLLVMNDRLIQWFKNALNTRYTTNSAPRGVLLDEYSASVTTTAYDRIKNEINRRR